MGLKTPRYLCQNSDLGRIILQAVLVVADFSLTKTDRQKIVRSHGGIGQSVAKKDRQRIAKKDRQRIAKKDRAKCSKKMERAKCSKKTMDSKKIELNYYLKKL